MLESIFDAHYVGYVTRLLDDCDRLIRFQRVDRQQLDSVQSVAVFVESLSGEVEILGIG